MIDVHFTPTPNGQKVTIALLEMELPYRMINYDMFEGDHLRPEFGKINLNHKLPAIIDHDPGFGGGPHAVFETAAILHYLAEKSGKLLPLDPRARSTALQWLVWQVAGMGPMCGQAAHFNRYAPEGNDYAKKRYGKEALRLLHVLNNRLAEAEYLAGTEYSIADIATWAWWFYIPKGLIGPINTEGFQNITRWSSTIEARPKTIAGISDQFSVPAKYAQLNANLTPEEWSNLYGENLWSAVKK